MEKEIIDLETAESIGIIDCLGEGISKFFENFVPFLKMLIPVLLLFISIIMLTGGTICLVASIVSLNLAFISFSALFFLVCMGFFFYTFWRYLLGYIAVSYLAKDIYENKPIQSPNDYYGYVERFSSEYVAFWLYNMLFCILFVCLLCIPCFLGYSAYQNNQSIIPCILLELIAVLLAIPVSIGLSLSKYFFAYQDKSKPLHLIIKAIKVSFKKFFPIFIFTLLLSLTVGVINFGLSILLSFLSIIIAPILEYFMVFVTTRYYFEIVKDDTCKNKILDVE